MRVPLLSFESTLCTLSTAMMTRIRLYAGRSKVSSKLGGGGRGMEWVRGEIKGHFDHLPLEGVLTR
jgi:hypothetical protein